MKKLFIALLILLLGTASYAVETTVSGRASVPMTGYDVADTRAREDAYMNKKSKVTKTEVMHTQQVKEASRQGEKRLKEDERLIKSVREAVTAKAGELAKKNAMCTLIDRILGAGASKKPEVAEKIDDLYMQFINCMLDQEVVNQNIDGNFVSNVIVTVDETAFREILSDFGLAMNTAAVRKGGILIVLDEFFAAPSDMHSNTLTKEVTTFDYRYSEKDKQTEKASYKDSGSSSSAGAHANIYGAGAYGSSSRHDTNANYGKYLDYSQNESVFFQNVKEYAPKTPIAQNINYTQPALVDAFTTHDIRSIDNDIFKSKFFKGKPVTADKLSNSEVLATYVNFAKNDAKADFFAIGVSYITDNGVSKNTGRHTCDGNVFVKIYSTADGEVIASGSYTDTGSGNTADQARVDVAQKIGNELGDVLSKKIQDYWKRRMMYGSEYVLEVKGNFLPAERMKINSALKSGEGIKNVSLRTVDTDKVEYVLNYTGSEPIGDAVFMQLIEASPRFNNYDYKINSNQIIFTPISKGTEKL